MAGIWKVLTESEKNELRCKLLKAQTKFDIINIKKQFVNEVMSKAWKETKQKILESGPYEIVEYHSNSFRITLNHKNVSFFPMSQKLHIHKDNKWIDAIPKDEWVTKIIEALNQDSTSGGEVGSINSLYLSDTVKADQKAIEEDDYPLTPDDTAPWELP